MTVNSITLRAPKITDGAAVNQLISDCPPLDTNSTYCNLLQCTHLSKTCAVAEQDSQIVGFISAYQLPDRPDTLFVWQIAIHSANRGQGLASKLLAHLLERDHLKVIQFIETTITEDNQASWHLFERLAQTRGAQLTKAIMFDKEIHFDGRHDTELLVTIGPFNRGVESQ